MTMGAGGSVICAGSGLASDSLGWTWTTGTEREVVVGLEGVLPELREREGHREKLPKKPPFLENRDPTQTLPIGQAAAAITPSCTRVSSASSSSPPESVGAWQCGGDGGTHHVPPGGSRRWKDGKWWSRFGWKGQRWSGSETRS